MEWYVRSAGHTDAHYGLLEDDCMTTARCGVRFRPQQQLFGDGPLSLHPPIDPLRCCPQCQTVDTSEQETDGAAVAGLIDTLGRHSR